MKKDAAKLMTEDKFWSIIKDSCGGQKLNECLSQLSIDELFGFRYWWKYFCNISYKQDLWAVAYTVMGGCSDDGFDYFRFWLIARGQEIFYAAMENADSLCDVFSELKNPEDKDYPSQEILDYAVINVFENLVGKDFYLEEENYEMHNSPYQNIEFEWKENDEDSIRKVCPHTFEKWWNNKLF